MPQWLINIILLIFGSKKEPKPNQDIPHNPEDSQIGNDGIIRYSKGTLPYMDSLLSKVGNKEIAGPKDNPVFVYFYKNVVGKNMHDETASCQAAVQSELKDAKYKYIPTLWAMDTETRCNEFLIRKDLSAIAVGDVATKLSTVANSKRHTFFVLAVDRKNKRVLALESNSGNAIRDENWYPFSILRFCGTPIKA